MRQFLARLTATGEDGDVAAFGVKHAHAAFADPVAATGHNDDFVLKPHRERLELSTDESGCLKSAVTRTALMLIVSGEGCQREM